MVLWRIPETRYDEEETMIIAKQSGAFGFIPKKAASSDLSKVNQIQDFLDTGFHRGGV
jgi:hypothetical protein